MMSAIRFILGKIILFLDAAFSPKGIFRDASEQALIDAKTRGLVVYQLLACPFCVKVRREIKRLSITGIEFRDIVQAKFHDELMVGGKLDQVPCLRIPNADGTFKFLYESDAINEYFRKVAV